LKEILGVFLLLLALVGLSWGGYLIYLHYVEAPATTQHAQNIRHSLNFVQAANQRAEGSIAEYTADTANGDQAHASADRLAACSALSSITQSEMQPDVLSFAMTHCGVGQ